MEDNPLKQLPEDILKELISLLKQELSISRRILGQTVLERSHVSQLEIEKIQESVEDRGRLIDELRTIEARRRHLCEPFLLSAGEKFSEMIGRLVPPARTSEINSLIELLRETIHAARTESRIGGEEAAFGLRVVSGLLSILTSSTHSVLRTYGPKGTIDEQVAPPSEAISALITREI